MKKYFKIISSCLLFSLMLLGCKKMEDSYKQFIEDGEIIYIGRADSILVRGGDNRVEVSWLLLSDPKVDNYKMYWNNYQDSVISEVKKTANVDTVRVLLKDMPEGLHHFEIIMYDAFGNHSVPARIAGRAYGEQYKSYLVNRIFKEPKELVEGDLQLEWTPAEEELLFTEIEYYDSENQKKIHVVKPDVELDTLKLFPQGGVLSMFSAYKPDSLALDTFYSKVEVFQPL